MEPEIFAEQFIHGHVFFFVSKGTLNCYDGNRNYTFQTGEYCLLRKNRLARYSGEKGKEFEVVFICFEDEFIKKFQEKHQAEATKFNLSDTFVKISEDILIPEFVRSLRPYYHQGKIDEAFADIKYEELLIILLQNQPELGGIFFNYGKPERLNLEEFMNRNYQFNVSIGQFAYLTGRSLSAFKRDFKEIFNETPSRWLVKKRLQEACFLITKEGKNPSDIYLDLGFETLSHFSHAFKKLFGQTPTEMSKK